MNVPTAALCDGGDYDSCAVERELARIVGNNLSELPAKLCCSAFNSALDPLLLLSDQCAILWMNNLTLILRHRFVERGANKTASRVTPRAADSRIDWPPAFPSYVLKTLCQIIFLMI